MLRKAVVVIFVVSAVAVAVLGLMSYARPYPKDGIWISWMRAEPRTQVAMIGGTLHVVHSAPSGAQSMTDSEKAFGGFYLRNATMGTVSATGVGVPFWAVALLLMIAPVLRLIGGPLRRHRRRRRNRCIACGYDLTGLTEPRCPECGTVCAYAVASAAAA